MTAAAPILDPPADAAPTRMQRLTVGLAGLARFARLQGLETAVDRDPGYALHALLAAGLGDLAPKPFAVDPGPVGAGHGPAVEPMADPAAGAARHGRLTLLGYGTADAAALADRLTERLASADASQRAAANTLTVTQPATKPMPAALPAGLPLAFRVRACPVIRSRTLARMHGEAASREVDVYEYRRLTDPSGFGSDGPPPPPDPEARVAAYLDWLAAQLEKDGAALPVEARVTAMLRRPLLRRGAHRDRGTAGTRAPRRSKNSPRRLAPTPVPVPDVTFEGVLTIGDPVAFTALLTRGIGRHRAFGFGMLLLAPA